MRTLLVACIVLALPLTIMGTPTDTINVRLEDHPAPYTHLPLPTIRIG